MARVFLALREVFCAGSDRKAKEIADHAESLQPFDYKNETEMTAPDIVNRLLEAPPNVEVLHLYGPSGGTAKPYLRIHDYIE